MERRRDWCRRDGRRREGGRQAGCLSSLLGFPRLYLTRCPPSSPSLRAGSRALSNTRHCPLSPQAPAGAPRSPSGRRAEAPRALPAARAPSPAVGRSSQLPSGPSLCSRPWPPLPVRANKVKPSSPRSRSPPAHSSPPGPRGSVHGAARGAPRQGSQAAHPGAGGAEGGTGGGGE